MTLNTIGKQQNPRRPMQKYDWWGNKWSCMTQLSQEYGAKAVLLAIYLETGPFRAERRDVTFLEVSQDLFIPVSEIKGLMLDLDTCGFLNDIGVSVMYDTLPMDSRIISPEGRKDNEDSSCM